MNMIEFHSVVTVVTFVFFVGVVVWAYSPSRKASFERQGMLPLEEDEPARGVRSGERS